MFWVIGHFLEPNDDDLYVFGIEIMFVLCIFNHTFLNLSLEIAGS
jgi:hypothetical protein